MIAFFYSPFLGCSTACGSAAWPAVLDQAHSIQRIIEDSRSLNSWQKAKSAGCAGWAENTITHIRLYIHMVDYRWDLQAGHSMQGYLPNENEVYLQDPILILQ
jgi:hypothetical protein